MKYILIFILTIVILILGVDAFFLGHIIYNQKFREAFVEEIQKNPGIRETIRSFAICMFASDIAFVILSLYSLIELCNH